MSGLIFAGMGKGIADAGAAYSGAMARGAELQWQEQRDDQREARALQRAEALERLKESLLEERAQKDAAKAIEVEGRAAKIGEERATKQFDTDIKGLINKQSQIAGDAPAMSEAEIRKLIEENPQYREVYRQAGYIDKAPTRNEQRLQAADDQVQAARELGASSTLLKSYQETKTKLLDTIRLENAERKDDRRYELDTAREDRRDREARDRADYQDRMARAAETRAGAAVTSANRPRSGSDSGDKPITGVDLERAAKAAEKALALELGVPVKDLQSEVARLRKRNQLTAEAQQKLDSYNTALTSWQNYKSTSSAPRGGDNSNVNSGSRPPLSSFMR